MATIKVTDYHIDTADVVKLLVWENVTASDTAYPINIGKFSDKTVQIFYTSGSGSTNLMQWSNDPRANPTHASHASAVWETMTDNLGNNISTTTNDGYQCMENGWWVRPTVTGGSSPIVNFALHMKRTM